jgi:hypothetical protein
MNYEDLVTSTKKYSKIVFKKSLNLFIGTICSHVGKSVGIFDYVQSAAEPTDDFNELISLR